MVQFPICSPVFAKLIPTFVAAHFRIENRILTSYFRVPLKQNLTQALETWGNESIERFFSPILQEESPATRSRRFKVFPNKLLIAPERYYKNSDWITEEYPVAMNVEDEIDLSWLKMNEDIKKSFILDG